MGEDFLGGFAMFTIETNASENFMRPGRRDFLRAGFLGLGGLTLADMLRAEEANQATSDTAVFLLFVHGGPSHLETYDLKPNAPDEIRGPFRPIRTNVAGIDVCEHLPKHARTAHRYSLIRSLCHDEADHFAGHRRLLSGYGQLKAGTGAESHYPQVGAVVNRIHPAGPTGLPSALAVGGVVVNGPDYAAGISEGYLGGIYRVPILQRSLPNANLRVSPQNFADRRALLNHFDQFRRELDFNGRMEGMDVHNRRALEILTSGRAQEAFNLSRESPRVVERYGPGYGQEVLIARRLIEAGVRFVTVRVPGSAPGSAAHDWDDHAVNWDLHTAMLARLPRYDHVVTTLIDDLYDRGLSQRVLLIVTGEFGRTPRLEYREGRIGRDHYPGAMSMLISGGGLPMGQVIGSTDSFAARPRERRLDPRDLLATIYTYLGIDPARQFLDQTGRPIALSQGEPIREFLGD